MLSAGPARPLRIDDLTVVHTHSVKGVTISILTATGRWTRGTTPFALEFHSAVRKKLIDVGNVILTAAGLTTQQRARPPAPARLEHDATAGRYTGVIDLTPGNQWQVDVRWDGRDSKGTATFVVHSD